MSKVSFSKSGSVPIATEGVKETPAIEVAATVTATAEAPATPAAAPGVSVTVTPNVGLPATVPSGPPARDGFHDDADDVDTSDLKIPYIQIVQKVGNLSNSYTPGTILLNGDLVLVDAPAPKADSKPLRILVVGLRDKCFIEKLPGGVRGKTFRKEAEVAAVGGTLDWTEANATGKPLYQRSTTGLLLVEQPEGVHESLFPAVIEGKRYALALYNMKGTAYTNAARTFLTAKKMGHLVESYRNGWWTLQSRLQGFNGNYAFIPIVRPQEASTPAIKAFLANALGEA